MQYFKITTIYIMSFLYITIGIKHFINPDLFIAIVPPCILLKKQVVFISGFIEVIMGTLLLFKKTRTIAGWIIILLLIGVFPANIYLYISDIPRDILNISKEQALLRIPFQIPLIIIAYWHSLESNSRILSIMCIVLFVPTIIYFATL